MARKTKAQYEKERKRRLEVGALNTALGTKRCPHCLTVGAWTIYDLERRGRRTRYVKCRACGKPDKVPVIVKEER
jgi:hypothetical protein